MKRTENRVRLCVTLLVINLLFIWGNSLLPGTASGALSSWVKELLSRLLGITASDPDTGHGLLRKLAHFTEFACLGVLLTWLISMIHKNLGFVPAGGLLAAGLDELIQLFMPGRHAALTDVLIDMVGVLVGMGVLCLWIARNTGKKNQQ